MRALNFLSLLSLLMMISCNGKKDQAVHEMDAVQKERLKIEETRPLIKDGDLIVRTGNDYISGILIELNFKDKTYSHCGMAFTDSGRIYVYHNMAGDFNPDEKMRRDLLDSFCNPVNNYGFGIYRYNMDTAALENLKNIFLVHYKNRLPFDMSFDLGTDDKMYCAELVAKSLYRATSGRIQIQAGGMNKKIMDKYLKRALDTRIFKSDKEAYALEYISLDNLYLNPHCKEIKQVTYKRPVISF